MSADDHPTPVILASFDSGLLHRSHQRAVEAHVAACEQCCRALEKMPDDPLSARIREFSRQRTAELADTRVNETTATAVRPELAGHPRYQILDRLGFGGMGVVYRALQRNMDRIVAVKVLHERLTNRPGFAERFELEVKTLARLNHPNIVSAYDADRAGGSHFLVMEFVEGESLDAIVRRRGPLPVDEATRLIRQSALGLQHAHERDMAHRDVKPQNLMLTAEGVVKVVDFGLARLFGETDSVTPDVIGTPEFMSPEQARDPREADVRSDLYSLGCTFYFLLAGTPPFERPTPLQVVLAHQHEYPRPIRDVRGDVSEEVANIVERLMSKSPANRFASAAEVVQALSGSVTAAVTAPRARMFAKPGFVAAGIVAVLLLTVAAVYFRHSGLVSSPAITEREEQTVELVPMPREVVPPTNLVAAHKRELAEQLLAWLKNNNAFGPETPIVARTSEEVEQGLDKKDGFQLSLGSKLVKSNRPTVVVARLGGFQIFDDLNERQRECFSVGETHRVLRQLRHQPDHHLIPFKVRLSDLRIDTPDHVMRDQPVTGTITCEFSAKTTRRSCLRLTVYHTRGAGLIAVMYYPKTEMEPGTSQMRFTFPALDSKLLNSERMSVVFVEWIENGGAVSVVESNALAALICFDGSAAK